MPIGVVQCLGPRSRIVISRRRILRVRHCNVSTVAANAQDAEQRMFTIVTKKIMVENIITRIQRRGCAHVKLELVKR